MATGDDLVQAQSSDASPTELENLATSRSVAVRVAVARHPATPFSALSRLAADKNLTVRVAVAEAGHATAHRAAAGSPDALVRLLLARQPHLDDEVLASLQGDEAEVRGNLARYTTSRPVFDTLLGDPDPTVRRQAAGNSSITPADCELLATDSDKTVRAAVAYSEHTPLGLVERLVGDRSARVRSAALSRLPATDEERRAVAYHLARLLGMRAAQRSAEPADEAMTPRPWRERLHVVGVDDLPRFPRAPFGRSFMFFGAVDGENELLETALETAWDSLMQEPDWRSWFEEHLPSRGPGHVIYFEQRTELSIHRNRRGRSVSVGLPVRHVRSCDDPVAYMRAMLVQAVAAMADVEGWPPPPVPE